ncbi:peptidase M16 [Clostridia bacterium]|nr:peptidase M16 [Clostridia bacterium]
MRELIANGVGFSPIIDEKFTTNTIQVSFAILLDEENSPLNALAASIIASNNSKYKTLAELSSKLSALYGASLNVSVSKRGDVQLITFYLSTIEDKFTFNGENITKEAIEIFLTCLFEPYIVDNGFEQEIFNFRKKDILDTIESEINNKRAYAIMQASRTVFKNEPCSFSAYGSKENAQKATPANAYEAYKNLLKNAVIEIHTVSPKPLGVKELFQKGFSEIERTPQNISYHTPSLLKSETAEITEELDVLQAKMVLGFKGGLDRYSTKLFSTILGEIPSAKLFTNVREKLSLCYYCASGYQDTKNAIMVDSGVETPNLDKAKTAILEQIDEIKKANITSDEISNAKLALENSLKGVFDTPSAIASWHLKCLQNGETITPEQSIEKYNAVTLDDIVKVANTFVLDTVYIMKPATDRKVNS